MADHATDSVATRTLSFERLDDATMRARANDFLAAMQTRRSVRHFSAEPVPLDVLRTCIETAAQAPSGANKQPWSFCLITDKDLKRRIRIAAEAEEAQFYDRRAPADWLAALQPLGTDAHKPFLEHAPALIAVFAHQKAPDGSKNYYVAESVGIAMGFLLAALHNAGLATLTHTPSPMRFLAQLLQRPANERAYLLLPVGYPEPGCEVPAIDRKDVADVLFEHEG